mmetsp:Transcript_48875/g.90155  ORF Transcript_48875/g.90155 Transcript_48875/m.90155 type:complete len:213 (+) Transcript_48875:64-702(+)
MSAVVGTMTCSRCGKDGHAAAACTLKSFFRSECSLCHRMGHTAESCPVQRALRREQEKKAYEQRQAQREEQKAAYEERQKKREEREARWAASKAAQDEIEQRQRARREEWAESVAAWEQDDSSHAPSGGDVASVYSESTAATNPTANEDKIIKKLEKKLREIEKLKERIANGEKLDALQFQKVGGEADIKMEIEDTQALAAARLRHAKKQEW